MIEGIPRSRGDVLRAIVDDGAHDDASWHRLPRAPRTRPRVERRSLYVPMRDGVVIAADVYVPRAPRPVPTILRQTRYFRSLDAAPPIAAAFDLYARTRRTFLSAGYAWVDVDVRGTGASTGRWSSPWSPDEVKDGAAIVDWIVGQAWSDGRVGSLGVSYDGSAADMLITARHAAVKAIAPLFSLYDVYADVAFPGGIHLAQFTSRWSTYNRLLDQNDFAGGMGTVLYLLGRAGAASPSPRGLERVLGPLARDEGRFRRVVPAALGALARGVSRVDADRDGARLAEAIAAHAGNADIHAQSSAMDFRDQTGLSSDHPADGIDLFSPHAYAAEARASGAAIYSISGWRDGAYPHSAIKRWASARTDGSRLTIGPWVHSGKLRVLPFDVARPTRFDFDAELLAFFDEHVRDRVPRGDGRPVHYYTMGEARWKSASSWPPIGATVSPFHLDEARRLVDAVPSRDGAAVHHESGLTGTGERSRWRSLLSLVPGDYPDRAERDARLLVFDTPPLEHAREVTGHPLVTLHVSWDDADDGHLFAYLEDVAPDGRVAYVSEGQLRACFRRREGPGPCASPAPLRRFHLADAVPLTPGVIEELAFDLLPISWLFRRGHRIRLAIAGADRDHFTTLSPRTFRVHHGPTHPSRVDLPVLV